MKPLAHLSALCGLLLLAAVVVRGEQGSVEGAAHEAQEYMAAGRFTKAEYAVYQKVRGILREKELATQAAVVQRGIDGRAAWEKKKRDRDNPPDPGNPYWVWYGDGRGWVKKDVIDFPN
jgi:hypothetical protein